MHIMCPKDGINNFHLRSTTSPSTISLQCHMKVKEYLTELKPVKCSPPIHGAIIISMQVYIFKYIESSRFYLSRKTHISVDASGLVHRQHPHSCSPLSYGCHGQMLKRKECEFLSRSILIYHKVTLWFQLPLWRDQYSVRNWRNKETSFFFGKTQYGEVPRYLWNRGRLLLRKCRTGNQISVLNYPKCNQKASMNGSSSLYHVITIRQGIQDKPGSLMNRREQKFADVSINLNFTSQLSSSYVSSVIAFKGHSWRWKFPTEVISSFLRRVVQWHANLMN